MGNIRCLLDWFRLLPGIILHADLGKQVEVILIYHRF
jgi:hypothetical protein